MLIVGLKRVSPSEYNDICVQAIAHYSYYSAMSDQSLKAELSRLDRNALRVLAKGLKLKSYGHLDRRKLVDFLLQHATPEQIKSVQLLPATQNQSAVGSKDKIRRFFNPKLWHRRIQLWAGICTILALVLAIVAFGWTVTHQSNPSISNAPTAPSSAGTTSASVKEDTKVGNPSSPPQKPEEPVASRPQRQPTRQPVAPPPTSRPAVQSSQVAADLRKAGVLYGQEKYAEAIALCQKVLSVDPNNAEARDLINNIKTARDINSKYNK